VWDALLALGAAAVGVVVGLRGNIWLRRKTRHALARAVDFEYRQAVLGRNESLSGTYRGFQVRMRFPRGEPRADFELHPVAAGIFLFPNATGTPGGGAPDAFVSGDPAFDDAIVARGNATTLLALLDADARESLAMHARDQHIHVEDGLFRARLAHPIDSVPRLTAALEALTTIASHLVPVGTAAARLRERATKDPRAEVRRAALEALATSMPDSAEARAAALAAVVDPEPSVVLAAARMLRADGLESLVALARNELVPVEVRIDAFESARTRMPKPESTQFAATVLKALRPGVRAHALRALAAEGALDQLPAIRARVLPSGGDAEEDTAAAEALGMLAHEENEPALLLLLRRDAPAVRLAAIRSLGVSGSASAVEALHAAGRDSRELANACEQAIAAIHARLSGAAPGQLAMANATDARGDLSVSTATSGAVALAPGTRERN